MTIPPEISTDLKKQLKPLVLFLDTNFLFGVLDVHVNPQIEASTKLMEAISTGGFPFHLRYHQATKREMDNTIDHFGIRLRSYRWNRSLSRAATQSRYLSGIELRYHQLNADMGIDVETFLKKFNHTDIFLQQKDIQIYRTNENRMRERADLLADYQTFLERRRMEKPYETMDHDVTVLDAARQIRSKSRSTLEAGCIIVTCDYKLYKFDWEDSKRRGALPCVIMPNLFWQILRPFIPQNQAFDQAFAATFAIPEFRTIGSGAAKASSKLLGHLTIYKSLSEDTIIKLITSDLLINKLRNAQNDQDFQDMVESAIVQDNTALSEEKAALEKQLQKERLIAEERKKEQENLSLQNKEMFQSLEQNKLKIEQAEIEKRAEQTRAENERIARITAEDNARKNREEADALKKERDEMERKVALEEEKKSILEKKVERRDDIITVIISLIAFALSYYILVVINPLFIDRIISYESHPYRIKVALSAITGVIFLGTRKKWRHGFIWALIPPIIVLLIEIFTT